MKVLFAFLLASFSQAPAFAQGLHEFTLKMNYQVECPRQSASGFPGITGMVMIDNRALRIDLFKYNRFSELTLALPEKPSLDQLEFIWDDSKECELKSFTPAIEEEQASNDIYRDLALKHSPYLVVRKDQLEFRERDLPIALAYSVMPTRNQTMKIRYTIFFTNETVKGLGSTTKAASLAHYGRRNDIEWMYDVEFDSQLKVVSRKYQSGIIGGLGHSTKNFKGRYLPGSEHPILFNIAKHNVFGRNGGMDQDGYPFRDGYHLVPREELESADAREWWQWRRPWVFDVTDRELQRGGGPFAAPSNEYLYVQVTGKLKKSRLRLNFSAESFFIRAPTLSKLGEGLWGRQSFTAVKMTEEEQQTGGTLSLFHLKKGFIFRKWGAMKLEPLRFYRLRPDTDQGFMMVDVTDQFRCDEDFECTFGATKDSQTGSTTLPN